MRLTLHQLKILRVVAEEGSISAAAKRLHLTSPTLSIQLGQLADHLGLPLYTVERRKLRLTGAGKDVLEAARRIDEELRGLEQRIAARHGIERGRLSVAAVSTAEYLLPGVLGQYRAAHPGIEASLSILPRDGVLARLEQGLDDVYVMSRPPREKKLQVLPVGFNPLVMIAAPGHPWAAREQIDLENLSAQRFVVREPGSGTRLWTADWLARFNCELKPELELGSNEAIKQAVAGGHGLAVISLHAVRLELASGRLVLLRAPHFPAPVRWYLVWRQGTELSPASEAFVKLLHESMPAMDAASEALLRGYGMSLASEADLLDE
jgi:DNA-binding transcriptional LysR family regulator